MHALVEAFFPATLVYLALVLPRARRHLVQPIAALGWCLSLALAIPYQLLLGQPGAYSILHGACETYLGLAGVALVARLVVEHAHAGRAAPVLLRCATAGALAGIGVPAIVMVLSGLSGGGLPVNVMTSTAFVFPLCLGWGVLRDRRERQRTLRTAIVGAPA